MWLQALLNSLLLYAIVISIALPSALFVAIMIMRTYLPGRNLLAMLMFANLAIPIYVQAGAWNSMFGQFGWWTLTQVGAAQNGWGGTAAVCTILTAYLVPWLVLCLCYGLREIRSPAEEIAWLETGPAKTLTRITLPLLVPYIGLAVLIALLLLSTDMTVTNLYRVDTITERFYQTASAGDIDGQALLMPALFGLISLLAIAAIYRVALYILQLPLHLPTRSSHSSNHEIRWTLSTSLGTLAGVGCWAIALLGSLLPQLNLIWNAGWKSVPDASQPHVTGYWSAQHFFRTLWQTPFEFRAEFGWSLYLGICSATLWLALALIASLVWKSSMRKQLLAAFTLCLFAFVPGPLAGLMSIYVWNRNWPSLLGWLYDHTLIAPITALGFRMFPFAIMAVCLIRSHLPQGSQEAAAVDAISPTRLWLSWYSRNLPAWIAAWIALLLISLADLSAVLLVLPPGVTPISARIFELLHYGIRYQESGICLILSFGCILGALCVYYLMLRMNPARNCK